MSNLRKIAEEWNILWQEEKRCRALSDAELEAIWTNRPPNADYNVRYRAAGKVLEQRYKPRVDAMSDAELAAAAASEAPYLASYAQFQLDERMRERKRKHEWNRLHSLSDQALWEEATGPHGTPQHAREAARRVKDREVEHEKAERDRELRSKRAARSTIRNWSNEQLCAWQVEPGVTEQGEFDAIVEELRVRRNRINRQLRKLERSRGYVRTSPLLEVVAEAPRMLAIEMADGGDESND